MLKGFVGFAVSGTAEQPGWTVGPRPWWKRIQPFSLGAEALPVPNAQLQLKAFGPKWDMPGLFETGIQRFWGLMIKPGSMAVSSRHWQPELLLCAEVSGKMLKNRINCIFSWQVWEQFDILDHDFSSTLSARCFLMTHHDGLASLLHKFRARPGDLLKSSQGSLNHIESR